MNNREDNNDRKVTFKSLRESAGYTQESLARTINLSKSMIGYYEAGKKSPKIDNFFLLAKYLGVSLKTLGEAMGFDTSGIPDDSTDNN